ncbi:MAG: SOS response-associated peptidase family protein [Chloroflexia bacterium]
MCGRYVLQNTGQIPLRFGATMDSGVRAAMGDRYNIAPTEVVPVVVEEAAGERRVELASWGISPRWRGAKPVLAF